MSIPPNQFRRDHPWTRFVLLDSSAGPVPWQAKVTHSLTLSLKKMLLCQLGARSTISISSPIIFKSITILWHGALETIIVRAPKLLYQGGFLKIFIPRKNQVSGRLMANSFNTLSAILKRLDLTLIEL